MADWPPTEGEHIGDMAIVWRIVYQGRDGFGIAECVTHSNGTAVIVGRWPWDLFPGREAWVMGRWTHDARHGWQIRAADIYARETASVGP